MVSIQEITDTLCIEFDYIDAGDLDLNDPILKQIESITARVDIHNAAIGIVADFRVAFQATFMCVRCLELFTTTCKSSLLLNYVPGNDPHATDESVDLTKIEIDKTYFTGSCIDLKIGIREVILLSIPIAPLCKEDCAGLCEKCGANRNKKQCTCVIEKAGLFTPVNVPDNPQQGQLKKKKRKCNK